MTNEELIEKFVEKLAAEQPGFKYLEPLPAPPTEGEILWGRIEDLERKHEELLERFESHRHVIGDGMVNGRYEKFATGEPINES
ncbi:hypothetical protein COURTHOUSE_166 [Mycobacterium phage Courthouse]|uniref:Uncharacterized protein n=2 Tax=Omegavirus courthouse TaxID=1089119 RepID=G8I5M3_9CAUD|nr:hypothetical protein CM09_gp166 [Mycobacterium phage Courthouse]YP_009205299.1 hypothetical protein AVT17_gp169 [Mycobacterium phage Ariel]YP_009213389.1 hypothetical protein AVV70_gp172 [Mycobacterium phage MiaZeal]ASZ74240.1 hypothetical protein SEA_SQUINT_164 [Mycobacterium phage Squint]ATS93008.1 hypothetical protein SEA_SUPERPHIKIMAN_167 [Mycobacterium phage Superphikiman]AER48017.1 hypothetical protein COURTHOUSE_166 [Mycobacterium phage Courthouse]AIM50046.1 hypothetical protein PBI